MKNSHFIVAFLVFFVAFFRLSLWFSFFYLAFFPFILGFFCLLKGGLNNSNNHLFIPKEIFYISLILGFLFLFSLIFDSFNSNSSFDSAMSIRILMIYVLSVFPAYYFISKINDSKTLNKVFSYNLILQIAFFFVMFISLDAKFFLYKLIGMGSSVNLDMNNERVRGFGLSAEINYMTPFLMVIISFFFIKKNMLLIFLVCLTQVVNSNMAVIAVLLGFCFMNINLYVKYFFGVIFFVFLIFLSESMLPRFYDEYVINKGFRTFNILLERHFFSIKDLDLFTILFGHQINISSSVSTNVVNSDVGWVILFNYGGLLFILLTLILFIFISFFAFGKNKMAIMWLFIGILLNTKGLALGPNGYMFLSFIFIFLKIKARYKLTELKIK